MDDVLADYDGEFYTRWYSTHPEIIIPPYEERKSFYIREELPAELHPKITAINTGSGFIRSLPEIPGALDAVREIADKGYDIFICTTPLDHYENCVLEKYEWIENHLGREWTKKLILTKDKTVIRGNLLIDDKPVVTGKERPIWEHILFDKPYNRHINDQKRINWTNWKTVLEI